MLEWVLSRALLARVLVFADSAFTLSRSASALLAVCAGAAAGLVAATLLPSGPGGGMLTSGLVWWASRRDLARSLVIRDAVVPAPAEGIIEVIGHRVREPELVA